MTIEIPQGTKSFNLYGMEIQIPEGAKNMQVDDNFVAKLKSDFEANQQPNTALNAPIGLDGLEIPQAPQMPQEQIVNLDKFNKKLQNINETINPLNLAKNSWDFLNRNHMNEHDTIKQKIADTQAQIQGGVLNQFFGDLTEEQQKQIHKVAFEEIKKKGLTPFLDIENGDIKYTGVDKNGKEFDFTPNFMNTIFSNKGEVALSVLGGGVGTQGLKTGATALQKAGNFLLPSATGASIGAGFDLERQSKNTGIKASVGDYAKRMASAGAEDALFGLGVAGILKGASKTYNGIKQAKTQTLEAYNTAKVKMGNEASNFKTKGNETLSKLRNISPTFINDYISGGVDTARNYNKQMINSSTGNYDELAELARTQGIETRAGNAIIDKARDFLQNTSEMSSNQTFKNLASGGANTLDNLSSKLTSNQARETQQELLNTMLANANMAKIGSEIIGSSPKLADNLAHSLTKQHEAFLKANNITNFNAENLGNLAKEAGIRASKDYENALKQIDELNPQGISLNADDLERFKSYQGAFNETTPKILRDMFKEIETGAFNGKNAKEINAYISKINKDLASVSKSYDYKDFLQNIKNDLIENISKNSTNPNLAKEIFDNARKDYANFSKFNESKIGKKLNDKKSIYDNESLSKVVKKLVNNKNKANNYNAIAKGLKGNELKTLDSEIINAIVSKNTIESDTLKVIDFEGVVKDLENMSFKSEVGMYKMEVVKTMARLQPQIKSIAESIVSTKAGKLSQGISSDFLSRIKMMIANSLTDYIAFYLGRLWEFGKRAGLRIQYRRALSNINQLQDFDKIMNKIAKQSKDKALKEFATKTKQEAKEKLQTLNKKADDFIQGENFVMKKDEAKLIFGDDYKFELSEKLKKLSGIDEKINASLAWLKSRHPEMFKNRRVVKEMIDFVVRDEAIVEKANNGGVLIKKDNDKKINELIIDNKENKLIHANVRKKKANEREVGEDALRSHTSLAKSNGRGVNVGGITPRSTSLNSNTLPQQTLKQDKPKTKLDEIQETIDSVKARNENAVKESLSKKELATQAKKQEILKKAQDTQKEIDILKDKRDVLDKSFYDLIDDKYNKAVSENKLAGGEFRKKRKKLKEKIENEVFSSDDYLKIKPQVDELNQQINDLELKKTQYYKEFSEIDKEKRLKALEQEKIKAEIAEKERKEKEKVKFEQELNNLVKSPYIETNDLDLHTFYNNAKSMEAKVMLRSILRNETTDRVGNGYNGYSMSNNAIDAYSYGQKPISKWNKVDADTLSEILGGKITLKDLKEFLLKYGEEGYHHTSKYFNKTKFYSLGTAFEKMDNNDELFKLLNVKREKSLKQKVDDLIQTKKDKEPFKETKKFIERVKGENETKQQVEAKAKADEIREKLGVKSKEKLDSLNSKENPNKESLNSKETSNILAEVFKVKAFSNKLLKNNSNSSAVKENLNDKFKATKAFIKEIKEKGIGKENNERKN